MAPRLSLRRRLAEPAGLLAGVVLLIAEMTCASHAAAQARARPSTSEPSVIVDYSVLDELGGAPNVPEALRPTLPRPTAGSAGRPEAQGDRGGRIVLRPPRARGAPQRLASRPAPAPRAPVLHPPRPKPAAPSVAATAPETASVARPTAPTPPARPKLAVRTPAPRPAAPRPAAPRQAAPWQAAPRPAAPRPSIVVEPMPRDDGQFTEPIDPRIAASAAAPESARPSPVPAAPPATPPARTAARTPGAAAAPSRAERSRKRAFGVGRRYSLVFDHGVSKLDADGADLLDEVADGLKGNGRLRLQLLAYAGGPGQSASQSRRLSLSRALSVRAYLIDKGVGSTRIDVRALGNRSASGPPDRVDVVVTER